MSSIAAREFLAFILLVILPCSLVYSQQGNIWYFGDGAGIGFNGEDIQSLEGGQTYFVDGNHAEGTATISNSQGQLLFYTNGETIWNKNHQIMLNGSDLLGSFSSSQSSIIIPKPNSSRYFYVFTTDAFINNLANGMRYSVVDMCGDSSNGAVLAEEKNVLLLELTCEKLAATRHQNGIDYWVIAHGYNSNEFYSFLVTGEGIQTPIVSPVGSMHEDNCSSGNSMASAIGQMKVSPDGTKIGVVNAQTCDNIKEVFEFNNQTGELSNPVQLEAEVDVYGGIGLSFSPDSEKIYISYASWLYQWDLEAGSIQDIQNSKIDVSTLIAGSADGSLTGMQIGPNGKIYIGRGNHATLAQIGHPDEIGTACAFQDSIISLDGAASFGMPSFVDDFDYSNDIADCTLDIASSTRDIPFQYNATNHQLVILQRFESFKVISLSGAIVRVGNQLSKSLDLSEISPGIYILQLDEITYAFPVTP